MRPVTDLRRRARPFEVISPYTPGGDQPAAIDELERRLRAGEKDIVLLGATGTGKSATTAWRVEGVARPANAEADLDADRYAKRVTALDIRSQELDKKEAEVTAREQEAAQVSQELDDRLSIIEEKEKSFKQMLAERDQREANIDQIARYINGMPPQKAVANLLQMDDQDIIDVLRAVEAIAKKANKASTVAYWFSLMPANRAADIQRKMANKPATLP